jgi:hypothetical protein
VIIALAEGSQPRQAQLSEEETRSCPCSMRCIYRKEETACMNLSHVCCMLAVNVGFMQLDMQREETLSNCLFSAGRAVSVAGLQ